MTSRTAEARAADEPQKSGPSSLNGEIGIRLRPLRPQRQVVRYLATSAAVFLVGDPVVTFLTVRNLDSGGAYIRIYGAAYGVPLLLAVWHALKWRPRARFRGSQALDVLVALMSAYWAFSSVVGLFLGNEMKYWVSTSFNFQVPVLAYVSTRRVNEPVLLDALAGRVVTICFVAAPLAILVGIYSVLTVGFVGAGGIQHLILIAGAVVALRQRRWLSGWLLLLGSILNILVSLKRAVWGGLILFPLAYLYASGITFRRLIHVVASVWLLLGIAWAGRGYLPEAVNFATLATRASSVYVETQAFTSGQAREDEVRSIWNSLTQDATGLALVFGRGMGATYEYVMSTTGGGVDYEHHDTHMTPAGWLLRGGVVGTAINAIFYLLALVFMMRAARNPHRMRRNTWTSAFAAYVALAVLVSVTSFSLTPNPVTHVMMVMVLMTAAVMPEQSINPDWGQWPTEALATGRGRDRGSGYR